LSLTPKLGKRGRLSKVYGRVAQLGEHRPYKPRVTGSSPVPPTIEFIPRKATTCDFSLALNINSCVAQA